MGSSGLASLSNVPRFIRSVEVLGLPSCFRPHLKQLPLFLVGSSGLEPPTSRLSGARSNHLSYEPKSSLRVILFHLVPFGGDDGIRTHDPLLAGQVLSQLSYTPVSLRFLLFPCGMLAPTYLPGTSPCKYCRHDTA